MNQIQIVQSASGAASVAAPHSTPLPTPSPAVILTATPSPTASPLTAADVYNQSAQAFTTLGTLQAAVSNTLGVQNLVLATLAVIGALIGLFIAILSILGFVAYKTAIREAVNAASNEIQKTSTDEVRKVTEEANQAFADLVESMDEQFKSLHDQHNEKLESLLKRLADSIPDKEKLEEEIRDVLKSVRQQSQTVTSTLTVRSGPRVAAPPIDEYQSFLESVSAYRALLAKIHSGVGHPALLNDAYRVRDRIQTFFDKYPDRVNPDIKALLDSPLEPGPGAD